MEKIPPLIRPAPTFDNFPRLPKQNEITFQIKCKKRNFCRNWKRSHVKMCLYCQFNFYHHESPNGIPVDNYDCWIPDIKILP